MMSIRIMAVVAAMLAVLNALLAGVALADEETPRFEASVESRRYTEAARREVLMHFSHVVGEIDRFPGQPTPEEAKKAELRKRLLDLRLAMDFNAFAYEPKDVARYRDLIDEMYEVVGQYKDLHDVQEVDGLPIDLAERDRRWNDMINAVAPFRQADVRHKFEKAYGEFESSPVSLSSDDRPRLWRIAGIEPTDSLDSAGNAARLGRAVLYNLRAEGLLVDDIFDVAQEERFHDVRKALRSVLVLADMFPSLNQGVAEVREPFDDLVKDYGKANDQAVAYHEAQRHGQNLEERAAALSKAFQKAQEEAREFESEGHLDAFAAALAAVEAAHRR